MKTSAQGLGIYLQEIILLKGIAQYIYKIIQSARKHSRALNFYISAPTGIWTRVIGSKGRYAWPDYTIGANKTEGIKVIFTFVKAAGHRRRIST